jgi:hypothetical protein
LLPQPLLSAGKEQGDHTVGLKDKEVLARLSREKPNKEDEIHFDDEMPGFGLWLCSLGDRVSRTWIVQARAGGKTWRISIGDAGAVGQSAAHGQAKKLLGQLQLGSDLQGEKKAKRLRQAQTLHSVAQEYLEFKEKEVAVGKSRSNSLKIARLYLTTGPCFRPLHALAKLTPVKRTCRGREFRSRRSCSYTRRPSNRLL